MQLQDRVAVVTGASSGIGEASAKALAEAGMTVYAVARRAERLEALAAAVPGVRPHVADVTDEASVTALAGRVREEAGACHVLVNNAGASRHRAFTGPDDVADVRDLMELNFFGVVRCMAAFADLLVASAPSRVVNVASIAGKVGVPNPSYAASKFAVVGFTEAVYGDWLRRGVTVSQLNPGFIATEGFPQSHLTGSALGRRLVGEPGQVAEALLDVVRSGKPERTVPRWYRPVATIRQLAPPLVRGALKRL